MLFAVIAVVWLVSPVILGIVCAVQHVRKKRYQEIFQHLYRSGRINDADMQALGMKPKDLPQMSAQHVPPVQTAPPPVTAAEPDTAADKTAAEPEPTGAPVLPPAAEVSAQPETAAEQPEVTAEAIAAQPEPDAAPVQAAAEKQAKPSEPAMIEPVHTAAAVPNRISAISLMLSVGVALIMIAGLIFVRSAWDSMSSPVKLAAIAAGSAVFFGASALARRVWKLERTGMAFFTLGAFFLPVSVWAAGYLDLLGDSLSGADNPKLYALAFASFAAIALYATKQYKKLGWAIALVSSGALAYFFAAGGLEETLEGAGTTGALAAFALVCALPAPILAFRAGALKEKLSEPMKRVIEPFAVCFACAAGLSVLGSIAMLDGRYRLTAMVAAACFLITAAWFAPAVSERLKAFTAIPAAATGMIGTALLLHPVYKHLIRVYDPETHVVTASNGEAYFSMVCAVFALAMLVLILSKLLPEPVGKGCFYAAFAATAVSLPCNLNDMQDHPFVLAIAAAVLLGVWLYAAHRKPSKAVSILIAAQSGVLAIDLVQLVCGSMDDAWMNLILAVAMILLFTVFAVTKKHRTGVSDLLFPAAAFLCAARSIWNEELPALQWTGLGLMLLIAALYDLLATAHDTERTVQYLHAAMVPVMLGITVLAAGETVLQKTENGFLALGWTALSAGTGALSYLTVKKRFTGVRRLLFGLTIVPPLLFGIFCKVISPDDYLPQHLLFCFVIAFAVWRLFANRGFKNLSALSFGTALLLLTEATFFAGMDWLYDGKYHFSLLMIAGVWLILASIAAICAEKRMLLFVGRDAVVRVMDIAAPVCALILSVCLLAAVRDEWEPFCFMYTAAFCVLSWFAAKRSHILTPLCSAAGMLLTMESLREQTQFGTGHSPVIPIAVMLLLTVLLPYLGLVLRESLDDPKKPHRAWALTALGGCMPFWLLAAANGIGGVYYSDEAISRMIFFVPVMLAAFVLHLAKVFPERKQKRRVIAIAGLLCVLALWIQPFWDVQDTYLEGKLHILPLVGFAVLIRVLYGEKIGGGALFAVGVYSMLRLGFSALNSENSADLLTVLGVALVMFIASFYVKQKKWFLLGGISLLVTAVYMHMKLTEGRQWWVYLLLAGLVLIVIAASNETLRQRGDSLRTKAGRLWDDWTW